MKTKRTIEEGLPERRTRKKGTLFGLLCIVLGVGAGCHSTPAEKQNREFFTSGSREADQRASQKMAQAEQLAGSGSNQKGKLQPVKENASGSSNQMMKADAKLSLYDRLGGEVGISNIVADLIPRALNDPRVNWARLGVKRGGFSLHRGASVTWNATPENVQLLQKHMVQFTALATGGPAHYEGKEIRTSHANLHISNAEFDAAIGDLKASLDRLKIPNQEQKELLAIYESTRPEIVVER